ncbi:hypothetical protein K466DRAFT_598861 [Polyporus arcularius HHB13444]|uniref:Carboxylesterase type B domain-containing protein n=1 Tax=Polyporus arcularius HHB13444 TaxID=1314778 RepID=A0A5C3PEJ2_9APHY|nr:hypothetical protein K466DRAFT_598861 [Polyporus arcularius HHB13444]
MAIPVPQPSMERVGCSKARDTLACLQTVSTDSLLAAANNTPPSGTGFVGTAAPYSACGLVSKLARHGKCQDGRRPLLHRDVKDEGIFSLGSFNITTDEEFAN